MDFNARISGLENRLSSVERDLKETKEKYQKCHLQTEKLLSECGKAGIKKISIGMCDSTIPSCNNWPFSHYGSVFATPVKNSDWPAIWGCVERAGLKMSCGNSDQAQIDPDELVDGVYELKSGKWTKVK